MKKVPPPSHLALEDRNKALRNARTSARSISHDLKTRQVRVRNSSIWQSPDVEGAVLPTFPFLLRGSGSSGMPLKLYLLLLWQAGSQGNADHRRRRANYIDRLEGEYTTLLDYKETADLLMIDDYQRASSSGVRRITSALRTLRDRRLIELHDNARSIRLLSETRDGSAYTDPGLNSDIADTNDLYITLPNEFFTCGWFSALSPQAVLALLIHRVFWIPKRPEQKPSSFNGEALSKYAPISKSTMTRGEHLLTHWSVLTKTEMRYPGRKHRSRYLYSLHLDRLEKDCPNEVPPTFR